MKAKVWGMEAEQRSRMRQSGEGPAGPPMFSSHHEGAAGSTWLAPSRHPVSAPNHVVYLS